MQIIRFCASGLDAINIGAAKIAQGADEIVIGGGVEIMSASAWARRRRRLVHRSVRRPSRLFRAAGHLGRPDRHQIRLLAATTSTPMRSRARSAPPRPGTKGRFKNSVIPVKDQIGLTILDHDEHMRPDTDMQSLAALNPSFAMPGEMGLRRGRACSAIPRSRRSTTSTMPAIPRASSTARPAVLIGSQEGRQGAGPEAARPHPRLRLDRLRAGDHADRPGRRDREAAEARRHEARRHRPVRAQRGLRRRRAALHAGASTSRTTRSTSTAAPSPWATRSAPPAR